MTNKENNSVYIMSIEGSDIEEHMRGNSFDEEYVGMLPESLNLDKLIDSKMKIRTRQGKKWSRDIINVSFASGFKSAENILSKIDIEKFNKTTISLADKIAKTTNNRTLKQLHNKMDSRIKFSDYLDKAELEDWEGINAEKLRTKLYTEGFTITYDDGEVVEYEVYKRSSSKSRTGKVLFINTKMNKGKLTRWARLGMNLEGATDVDYPSLLSYESLVDSHIEDRIEIDVDKILMVSDVKSVFSEDVNLIVKNKETELLESKLTEGYQMKSDIFDGEGLLDSQYFTNGKGFLLARQHMFKSALFNTNIQDFLMDNCPEGVKYSQWKLVDMFDNEIFAKDVHMITTPNSLKALKFSHKKKCDKVMYEHWKAKIKAEDNMFGVVMYEEESQKGYDEEGNILNQTAYQHLNSMPFTQDDIDDISTYEQEYIMNLKNDIDTYIEFLAEKANDMNSNEMWVDLYKKNKNIMYTELFKSKRKQDIKGQVNYIRRGKLRLKGDYTVIMQNGKELLYHSIGKLPVVDGNLDYKTWESNMELVGNECHTTLHDFNREYTAFRNPHTSMSNVLILENKKSDFISEYFNLTDNIIMTNAINFSLNRILSGSDVDSDNLVIFDNPTILRVARDCYIKSSKYRVCENGVAQSKNEYTVCNEHMAKIDNILAKSQQYIGRVVNLGAIYLSRYWEMVNQGETDKELLEETRQAIDIATCLSEISIDMAKRFYDVDIDKQIKNLELDVEKPQFMRYTSNKNNTRYYDSSMDYLQEIMDNLPKANEHETKDIYDLLSKDIDSRKVKKKQVVDVTELINRIAKSKRSIEADYADKARRADRELTNEEKQDKYNKKEDSTDYYLSIISRFKIETENIHKILADVYRGRTHCTSKVELMNTVYKTNEDAFLRAFR